VTLGYLFHGIHVNLLAPVTLAKRTDLVAGATMIGPAVSISSNFLLIPRWGLMGAASATLLAYLAMSAALFLIARRVYPVGYEYRRLGHLAACLTLSLAAFWAWGRPSEPFQGLALRLGLLLSYPALLLVTGFFDGEELSGLKALAARSRAAR
jgi:O-antigen/teichoic acid export membrane protein